MILSDEKWKDPKTGYECSEIWSLDFRNGVFLAKCEELPNEAQLLIVNIWGIGYHKGVGWVFGHTEIVI